jgi:hypothetical protein
MRIGHGIENDNAAKRPARPRRSAPTHPLEPGPDRADAHPDFRFLTQGFEVSER